MGVYNGTISTNKELIVWGLQPDGEQWPLNIVTDPIILNILSGIKTRKMAIIISQEGNKQALTHEYEHTRIEYNGQSASRRKIRNLIVLGRDIDLISTISSALNMINQISNVYALIIDKKDVVYTSKNLATKGTALII
jgi:hypothetical protein